MGRGRNRAGGAVIGALSLLAGPVGAQDAAQTREARPAGPQVQLDRAPGTVYTFYGLRKLEQDREVPEAEKLREWRAYIERAEKETKRLVARAEAVERARRPVPANRGDPRREGRPEVAGRRRRLHIRG